ncbi:helix-turn-helix domain-containing protein [Natrarchaeobaculum sulfurireducens]|uniref:Bacterio-opsin activator domain-containingprotein n=1 Tax=Natrarchaeobaculum sulfurireducens TaxID=2044521 RepID=A0A346PIK3_9EURY|nr:helix-turn-helix domain-containing protein [Natrarchaeobaculum sulfurireducens]AXR79348.1 Transcriptional regulator, contains HTH domain [Natrarchaeobaculum sulfurireducens]AXR83119.1 Bacterio-opsin activator domain-containingprotein [Natrarchaeobaculum sulfurireducens]
MKALKLDMVQYDCPYIRTTRTHNVAFRTQHWDFNQADRTLETRLLAIGETPTELHGALETLEGHEMLRGYELLSRKQNTALLRSRIDETDAMQTIRRNDGYVTGPFVIRNGSEIWNVGFDRPMKADDALSELDGSNEFTVQGDDSIQIDDFFDILQNVESLGAMLRALQNLTDRERETLEIAVEKGYFSTPRGTTLDGVAEEFDISKMGASKNLRRSQRKVLRQVVQVMNDVEAQMELQEEAADSQWTEK